MNEGQPTHETAAGLLSDPRRPSGLFEVAAGAMMIVLALIFEKVSATISDVVKVWNPEIWWRSIGYVSVQMAILLALVSVILTLAHVHKEGLLRYERFYIVIDVVVVAFMFFLAVRCMSDAIPDLLANKVPTPALLLERVALVALVIAFLALLVRSGLALSSRQVMGSDHFKDYRNKIYGVMFFHLMGAAIAALALGFPEWIPALGLGAVPIACGYLVALWILRIQVSLDRGGPYTVQDAQQ